MATTVVAEDTGRAKPRFGDRIFSGLSLAAGIAILVALAGVFIFLAIEGLPAGYVLSKGDKLSALYSTTKYFLAEIMETIVADGTAKLASATGFCGLS